ncbi:MAG: Glu-tRNA(Gln) amidotransferase subunit GatD [Candidatus ainarchaeum sp.]|nr:Glu-tRNA(Gln) amidotransferase subunit GatD [Candidatus ainarchaeum sp.]
MYSKSLLSIFNNKNISLGDRISVKKGKNSFEGILMPRAGEKEIIVLKLDNGYNIGIDPKDAEFSLIEKYKKKKEEKEQSTDGEISILGCGGTISSKVEYKTGAVYPLIKPKELLKVFPEISKISTIKTKSVFSLLSEDMTQDHWKIIGESVFDEINNGSKGVVLMHGTDTMHYTSAALSFMFSSLPVPVILVGAQRSSDRPSSDNRINLINSVYAATKEIAEVMICMHAESSDNYCYLHRGTRVRKMHTSRRDAFKSINSLPLAISDFSNSKFEPLSEFKKRNNSKPSLDSRINPNVALIQTYPGIKPEFIDSLRSYDGVVIAATGLGNVPSNPFGDKNSKPILQNIRSLIDSGITVAIAPQTIYGRINLGVYSAGRILKETGVIGDGADWTPETAFVKMCFVLGREKKPEKIRELMMKNLTGEISERSVFRENFE